MTFREDFEARIARVVLADSRIARGRDMARPIEIELTEDEFRLIVIVTVPYITHVGTPSVFLRVLTENAFETCLTAVLNG